MPFTPPEPVPRLPWKQPQGRSPALAPDPPPEPLLPFEDRDHIGFVTAYFATLRDLMLSPIRSMERLRRDGDLMGPVLFNVVTNFLVFAVTAIILWATFDLNNPLWANLKAKIGDIDILYRLPEYLLIGSPFLAAFSTGCYVFFYCGFIHVFAMLFTPNHGGFAGTVKALGYSAASNLLGLIPWCGWLISLIHMTVIQTVGFRRVHGTSTFAALVIISLPLTFILVVTAAIVILLFKYLGPEELMKLQQSMPK